MNLDQEIGFTWSPLKVPVLLMILSISSEKLSLFSRFFLIMILDIINVPLCFSSVSVIFFSFPLVAGAWTEREKMYHGGSFLKLADDDMDIQNPEAQNRELGGF